jgi:hypothetical protein
VRAGQCGRPAAALPRGAGRKPRLRHVHARRPEKNTSRCPAALASTWAKRQHQVPRVRAGKKRLLRKCEYWKFPAHVATISVSGSRLYVGDAQESLFFLK